MTIGVRDRMEIHGQLTDARVPRVRCPVTLIFGVHEEVCVCDSSSEYGANLAISVLTSSQIIMILTV